MDKWTKENQNLDNGPEAYMFSFSRSIIKKSVWDKRQLVRAADSLTLYNNFSILTAFELLHKILDRLTNLRILGCVMISWPLGLVGL